MSNLCPILRLSCRVFVVGLLAGTPALGAGETPSQCFLSATRPVTATQTALGGLPAAGASPAASSRANPAGLARGRTPEACVGHQRWQGGLASEWLGGSIPVGIGTLGIEISAMHAGSLPGFDPSGVPTGSFQPMEIVLGGAWGYSIAPGIRFGFGGRWMGIQGGQSSLAALGFDLGVEADLLGCVIGGGIRNLGPDAVGASGRYPVTTEYFAGGSRRFGRHTGIDLHCTMLEGGEAILFGGARIDGPGGFSILGGAAYRSASGRTGLRPRGGLAIEAAGIDLSYAFVPDEDTGDTHQFTLALPLSQR